MCVGRRSQWLGAFAGWPVRALEHHRWLATASVAAEHWPKHTGGGSPAYKAASFLTCKGRAGTVEAVESASRSCHLRPTRKRGFTIHKGRQPFMNRPILSTVI